MMVKATAWRSVVVTMAIIALVLPQAKAVLYFDVLADEMEQESNVISEDIRQEGNLTTVGIKEEENSRDEDIDQEEEEEEEETEDGANDVGSPLVELLQRQDEVLKKLDLLLTKVEKVEVLEGKVDQLAVLVRKEEVTEEGKNETLSQGRGEEGEEVVEEVVEEGIKGEEEIGGKEGKGDNEDRLGLVMAKLGEIAAEVKTLQLTITTLGQMPNLTTRGQEEDNKPEEEQVEIEGDKEVKEEGDTNVEGEGEKEEEGDEKEIQEEVEEKEEEHIETNEMANEINTIFYRLAANLSLIPQHLGNPHNETTDELVSSPSPSAALTPAPTTPSHPLLLTSTLPSPPSPGPTTSPDPTPGLDLLHEATDVLARIESELSQSTNATLDLLVAIMQRLSISDIRTDQSLSAVMRSMSLRQRVMQDTLLAATASAMALVRDTSDEVKEMVESRMAEVSERLEAVEGKVEAVEGKVEAVEVKVEAVEGKVEAVEAKFEGIQEVMENNLTDALVSSLDLLLLQHQENLTQALDLLANLTSIAQQPSIYPQQEGLLDLNGTTHYHVVSYNATNISVPFDTVNVCEDVQVVGLQVGEVLDQLTELRKYYDASLQLYMDQLLSEVAGVPEQVKVAVQEGLASYPRHLDTLARSFYGYLDAAVTSVSSAAVTSAQVTADQVTEALVEVKMSLEKKLAKVEATVTTVTRCPSGYAFTSKVCLLAVPSAQATWHDAWGVCRDMGGGDLALVTDAKVLKGVTNLVHPKAAGSVPMSFWVGGWWVPEGGGEWMWADGSPVTLEMGVMPPLSGGGDSGGCLALMTTEEDNDLLLMATSCDTPRGVLCQYLTSETPRVAPARPRPSSRYDDYVVQPPSSPQYHDVYSTGPQDLTPNIIAYTDDSVDQLQVLQPRHEVFIPIE